LIRHQVLNAARKWRWSEQRTQNQNCWYGGFPIASGTAIDFIGATCLESRT